MQSKQFYHTVEQYSANGLEPFLDHILDYLTGYSSVPVSKTSSINGLQDVKFTFSNELLKRFIENRDALNKPYDVSIKYGFRGHSKGGQTGIFYQRNEDKKMIDATTRLIESHKSDVMQDLNIGEEGLDSLKKVKVVLHNLSGERLVGMYNTRNNRIIFLDFASY